MKKIILSVIGYDQPGIVAYVARTLADLHCNIENVSQTSLQGTFAGIFTAACPADVTCEALQSVFERGSSERKLKIHIDPIMAEAQTEKSPAQEFVVTTKGPDGQGLVAGITGVLAEYKTNISNLQAYFRGGTDANDNGMIYQVEVPLDTDLQALRRALRAKALELGLEISIQHNDIFMAVNRL